MRRLLYLVALATVASLILAPAALAQDSSLMRYPGDCPAGTRGIGDASGFTGCVPVEELCDVNALTPSQYSECIATPEEITDVPAGEAQYEPGTGPLIGGSLADAAQVGADGTLPDTGGPALLLPAGGLLLATGLIGIKLARRRS